MDIPIGIREAFVDPDTDIKQAYVCDEGETLSNRNTSNLADYATSKDVEASTKIIQAKATKDAIRVSKQPAKSFAERAIKQRVSNRVLLAKHSEQMHCVCEITGIVSLLDIPAIPLTLAAHSTDKQQITKQLSQQVLIYRHPLGSLPNARGLAQAGLDYLRRLDTQILAGILIVLADAYSLFRYQPTDSGAQKNAILRTAGKDVLIDAIILVEDAVHSHNKGFLPKLSLILDTVVLQGEITVRLSEWTKLVTDMVYTASSFNSDDEDAFYAEKPFKRMTPLLIKQQDKEAKAADWQAKQQKWATARAFKEDKAYAKKIIPLFAKSAGLSLKLTAMIKGIFTDDTLLTISADIKGLLIGKLEGYTQPEAASLIAMLKADRSELIEDLDLGLDDLASLDSVEPVESKPVDAILTDLEAEPDDSESFDPIIEASDSTSAKHAVAQYNSIHIEVEGKTYSVDATLWATMGIIDRIRYKKALPKGEVK